MGSMQASEMAMAVGEGEVSMRHALLWHLQTNHYPPINAFFVDTAMRAINLAADEEYGDIIELPNGNNITVEDVCDQLHLWDFVQQADACP